jgi:hypothetical protein
LESWKKLHDFITYALDKSKPIVPPIRSASPHEIRGLLLQESEHVFTQVNLVAELSAKRGNVLQRSTSIRGVRDLSAEETRRLEADWNAVFTKSALCRASSKPGAASCSAATIHHLFPRAIVRS